MSEAHENPHYWDYREEEAQERYARKHGIRCTCMYRLDCPLHDPIPEGEEEEE